MKSQTIALFCLVTAVNAGDHAAARSDAKSSHKPPHKTEAASPSQSDPEPTSTIQRPQVVAPPVVPVAPAEDDESLPTPFTLPVASRARMRTCGERWQAIKMAGTAGTDVWREFATKCLASKD